MKTWCYLARLNKHNRRNIGPHINLDNRHAFVIHVTYMIVLDASTIILLGKINLLETFVLTFSGRVLIFEKVRDEISIKETEENPLIVKLIKDKKMQVLKVNPVRNSSGALNPALRGGTPYGAEPGIILKSNPAAASGSEEPLARREQRGIISNGVKSAKLIKKLMDDFNSEIFVTLKDKKVACPLFTSKIPVFIRDGESPVFP